MAKRSSKKQQPPVSLPEDLLVEVLARVPYSSLCRFKCVSRSWLALCSDLGLRRRSPQTLSGFFCYSTSACNPRFVSLSGKCRAPVDPDLPFLRCALAAYRFRIDLVHCCSGLLLCRCFRTSWHPKDAEWVVCNPATEQWTILPATEAPQFPNQFTFRLGFDPAFPSRFEVFVLKQDPLAQGGITGVEIYSSGTGLWTSNKSQWGSETRLNRSVGRCVFFGGTLHLTAYRPSAPGEDVCSQDSACDCDNSLVTVDTEGKTWRKFRMPYNGHGFASIGQSQGRLYSMHIDHKNGYLLSVWVLEDYATGQWTLMHTGNIPQLFDRHCRNGKVPYMSITVHPECNLIFLIDGKTRTIVTYNMDERKVHAICNISGYYFHPYQPYVPCFVEWSSDGK